MGRYYEMPELHVLTLTGEDIVTISGGEGFAKDFNDWKEGNPFGEVGKDEANF